ncbi:hypothetical protein AGABI1DRAFT_93803 [Agaricus bisporus var. burnettii JB137-S8]|uniref:Extracellular membrane protein CFEM domain-containing protein n=1 Tax=Agaricus bisporus var. burnettii (strain JB137-S8 / ATCC MYA-4627 / FGSC 10392) TaxID=597362 RepID=K5VQX1_AGABU|nr:uncharacterized protein AGABI1DRAFT_93803 [Agaricus bisporus var. burnettii JB137-S8]EKM76874.1 hypothetical protein AGABI1DRAFT_93803 [Agaricus bisporus var. burnettii JB137-S8]
MVSFTSALVFTTLTASAIHVSANTNGALHELVARQTFDPSSVPEQCQRECSAIVTALTDPNCGNDLGCVCRINIAEKTRVCAQCEAQIIGEEEAKSLYDTMVSSLIEVAGFLDYAAACKSGGIDVPSFDGSSANSDSNTGSSNGGNDGDNRSTDGTSNLHMSAASVAGTAALAFLLAA